ncbi:MAG: methyltransferase family protein [Candidatus Hodarchaeota archaeon]
MSSEPKSVENAENISRFSKKLLARKIVAILIFVWIYYFIVIWLLAPGLYQDMYSLFTLILYCSVASIDILIRPLPEKTKMDKFQSILTLFSFLAPFFMVWAYHENRSLVSTYISSWNSPVVAIIGIVILIIGSIIMVGARATVGKFGTPVLTTGKGHALYTKGLYKHVRHPMYTGGFLMFIAPFFVLRSIITLVVMLIIEIFLLKKRMDMEESMLKESFGEEYTSYMKRTKRLFPLIY